MTIDEAKKIAHIIGTADHACPVCVANLVEQMNEAFPEFTWVEEDFLSDTEFGEERIGISVIVTTRS